MRPADPGDSRQLAVIAEEAYGTYAEKLTEPPAPLLLDYSEVAASGRTYVAVECGEILGMVTVEPSGPHMILRNLAVRPSCQGKGVGTELVDLVEGLAREAGMDAVRLWTRAEMLDNISFYNKRRYSITHHEQDDQSHRVFFIKWLNVAAHRNGPVGGVGPAPEK